MIACLFQTWHGRMALSHALARLDHLCFAYMLCAKSTNHCATRPCIARLPLARRSSSRIPFDLVWLFMCSQTSYPHVDESSTPCSGNAGFGEKVKVFCHSIILESKFLRSGQWFMFPRGMPPIFLIQGLYILFEIV